MIFSNNNNNNDNNGNNNRVKFECKQATTKKQTNRYDSLSLAKNNKILENKLDHHSFFLKFLQHKLSSFEIFSGIYVANK